MTTAAGQLLAVLDANLVTNAYWDIYDDLGGNVKVYRQNDAARNSVFYVKLDDSNAVFTVVELWEGWDLVAHAGTGQRLYQGSLGSLLYIIKSTDGWALRVRDNNFIFIDTVTRFGNYVGQLNRFDSSKNMPILICSGETATPTYNPLGARNYDGATANSRTAWRCLFNEDGNIKTIFPWAQQSSATENSVGGTPAAVCQTILGEIRIRETPVYSMDKWLLMGVLDGVMHTNTTDDSHALADGETVDVNGVIWEMIKSAGGDAVGFIVEKV